MPEYKNYENENLRSKLTKIMANTEYGEFKGIVVDTFLRRAYEFKLPESQILKEATHLTENIKRIDIAYGDEYKKEKWLGVTQCGKKTILINGEQYKQKLKMVGKEAKQLVFLDMYETLVHEIFHGIGIYNPEKELTALVEDYRTTRD